MGGTCKGRDAESVAGRESRESRRDAITTGAMRLGELMSGEKQWRRGNEAVLATYPNAEVLPVPDTMARDSVHAAAGLVQLVKRVCAEELEPYREAIDRLTRDACEREAVKVGIGGTIVDEPIAIGDTFRWIGGSHDGQIGEVTMGPIPAGDEEPKWALVTDGARRDFTAGLLLDPGYWTRVRAVEQAPTALDRAAASPALAAALAAPAVSLVGGHEMRAKQARVRAALEDIAEQNAALDGDDLDGPAGDERVGLTEAGAAAVDGEAAQSEIERLTALLEEARDGWKKASDEATAMASQRDAWEASATSAAAELREVAREFAAIETAWKALDPGYFTMPRLDVNDAIGALSRRVVGW